MPVRPRSDKIRALVQTWLLLDFFDQSRRAGTPSSTLTTTIFSQSFLALVVAALIYPEPPPVPFAAANLSLSTLLVALSACDFEPALARRRADSVLLTTAPLGRLPVAIARAAHGTFHLGLKTIGLGLPPAILLAIRQGEAWLVPAYLLLAVLCGGLAAGGLAVLLAAVRTWFGGARAALFGGTLKAVLLGGGFALFAISLGALSRDADALPIGRLGANLLPPYHAAKFLAAPATEAWRAAALLGVAFALLLASAFLGEREREGGGRARPPGLLHRLVLRCAGNGTGRGPDRAIAAFTATLLWRSPGLRGRVLPLLGVPAAMAFLALRGGEARERVLLASMALQFPAIYLPFVLAFLTHADQPGSRWIFDSAPCIAPARAQRAVWLALLFGMLLPVQAIALVLLLVAGVAPGDALPAAGVAFGLGGLAARVMVRGMHGLPFSVDDAGDQPLELGSLTGFGLALAAAAAVVASLPLGMRAGVAAGCLATLAALAFRRPPEEVGETLGPTTQAAIPGRSPDAAEGVATEPAAPDGNEPPPTPPVPTLRRELLAITTLYGLLSLLPLGIGFAFAP